MGESIKLQEADMEETTKTEELEMEKGTYLKETNMEEAIKSKEKNMHESINVMGENMRKKDDFSERIMTNLNNTYTDGKGNSIRLLKDGTIEKIKPEEIDKFTKVALKYYSDPYKSEIDPGVPAPLRLYWSEVDESTKNKYPTAKECYLDGQFMFRRFLKWMGKHGRAFIELSWENKKISIWELNKCYGKNGELNGWKLGELLEEKRIYLEDNIREKEELLKYLNRELGEYKKFSISKLIRCYENDGEFNGRKLGKLLEEKRICLEKKIKEKEELLNFLNRQLFSIEKIISRGCVCSDGLTETQRIMDY